jgi:CxxC motif-containing protein
MKKSTKSRRKAEKPLNKEKAKRYTCIVCPVCCELETDGVEVNGARCPKGEAFALQEIIMPLRVLTTTVHCVAPTGTKMLPVKTANAVPLGEISNIAKEIKALRVSGIPAIGSTISLEFSGQPIMLLVTGELD